MKIKLLSGLSILIFTFLSMTHQAQALDITNIKQGIIKDIKSDSLKMACDPNGVVLQMAIDPNTVYDNVQKWSDIKVGDKVQVVSKISQRRNIAITITKIENE
jgi:hypothetical protein